jgi:hypothetical protein
MGTLPGPAIMDCPIKRKNARPYPGQAFFPVLNSTRAHASLVRRLFSVPPGLDVDDLAGACVAWPIEKGTATSLFYMAIRVY